MIYLFIVIVLLLLILCEHECVHVCAIASIVRGSRPWGVNSHYLTKGTLELQTHAIMAGFLGFLGIRSQLLMLLR